MCVQYTASALCDTLQAIELFLRPWKPTSQVLRKIPRCSVILQVTGCSDSDTISQDLLQRLDFPAIVHQPSSAVVF